MAQSAFDFVAAWELVALLRLCGVFYVLMLWCCELFLNPVEKLQEVGDGVDTAGNLWVGAVLNEILEPLAGTVENSADLQPLGLAQHIAQLDTAGGRSSARKNQIRHRT